MNELDLAKMNGLDCKEAIINAFADMEGKQVNVINRMANQLAANISGMSPTSALVVLAHIGVFLNEYGRGP